MAAIRLGISTCPNDTFAFHALIEKKIDLEGLTFDVELLDVQELNEKLFAGDYDVAKASFHAALRLSHKLGVLRSGSALGFGNGPLLLASEANCEPRSSAPGGQPDRVLCPGEHTTAHLLYKLFFGMGDIQQVVFSEIMPALQAGEADFGVCIHEGRFTWREQGLHLVDDLGRRWEEKTSCPLPLGGILARHHLGDAMHQQLNRLIRASIEYAQKNPEEALVTMRAHAQEFDDEVLMSHVELYVNRWTLDLGDEGRRALEELSRRAAETGLVAEGQPPLRLLGGAE